MGQPGYVYVLTNSSTNGIVKVGKTRQNPDERAKAFSSASGVPTPFVVVYQAFFADVDQAERHVHSRLEKFRVSNNREFFQVAIPAAVDAVLEAKNDLGGFAGDPKSAREENINRMDDCDSIAFGTVREPEKGLYELLDVFINQTMRGWNNFVKSMGLSMPQFSILMQLYYRGAFSISEISDRFGISVPAASQLVEKLVQAGYLERAEDPKDRRARLLPLSSKGKKLIEQGFKSRYRWMDGLSRELTPEERAKVAEALQIMIKASKELETESAPPAM
jgi:DNA-binding MarR family transcriptional regulator